MSRFHVLWDKCCNVLEVWVLLWGIKSHDEDKKCFEMSWNGAAMTKTRIALQPDEYLAIFRQLNFVPGWSRSRYLMKSLHLITRKEMCVQHRKNRHRLHLLYYTGSILLLKLSLVMFHWHEILMAVLLVMHYARFLFTPKRNRSCL